MDGTLFGSPHSLRIQGHIPLPVPSTHLIVVLKTLALRCNDACGRPELSSAV
jgi:hypothetical protein